jgi:hypothetical protein
MIALSTGAAIAILALVPMITGPLPGEENRLTIALCAGGTLEIPLGKGEEKMPDRDCPAAGCHAATGREKAKRRSL